MVDVNDELHKNNSLDPWLTFDHQLSPCLIPPVTYIGYEVATIPEFSIL